MSTSTMPIIKGLFLLLLFGYSMSASNRRCSPLYDGGSFCFTQPDPPVNLSWSSAMQWCKNMNATLPMVNSSYHYSVYQNALGYFGLQAETLWLGANSTYDPDNWFWTDGSNFTGDIESSNSSDQTSAYVMRNGSALMFGAANPSEYNYYICQVGYSELVCVSNPNTFWTNGKCYYKHNSYYSTVSWYSFLSNCGPSSLPSYDDLKEFSRWLDNLVKFWIGLRCGWWSWHDMVSGRSFALTQNWAGGYLPSVVYGQCLASYRYSYGASHWTSLDCTRTLPFVCQENVNVIQSETTAQKLTTTTSEQSTSSFNYGPRSNQSDRALTDVNVTQSETTAHKLFATESEETTSSFNYDPRSNPSDRALTGLAIGLGVGLGGGLLLVVVLLTLYACRKHRDTNYSLVDLPNQSAKNQNTTAPIAYVNYAFNVASGALGRNTARNPYEPVNHKANEHVY